MIKLCDNIQPIYELEIKKGNTISMVSNLKKSKDYRATFCVFMKDVIDNYSYDEMKIEKDEIQMMHYPYEKYYYCRKCGCIISGPLSNSQKEKYKASPFEKEDSRIIATPQNVYWMDDERYTTGKLPVWKESFEEC